MNPDELLKAPNCSGVYYFRNKLNGKYYVGQADKLRKRLRHHVSNVKCNRYDNPIYRAIRKYGWENFEWKILEIFEDELYEDRKKKLDEAEERYIKEFNSYGATGYNQTRGGDGGIKGYKFTPEQIQHRREVAKNIQRTSDRNIIYFYNIETEEYGQWFSWADFRKQHNIKTNHLGVLIHGGKFVVGRTKEQIEEKLKKLQDDIIVEEKEEIIVDKIQDNIVKEKEETNPKDIEKLDTQQTNTKVKKKKIHRRAHNSGVTIELSEDKIKDIKDGMKWEEYCQKYSVCRKTYFSHKNIVFPNKQREYNTKVNLAIYEKYRKSHTREETAQHFNISEDLTFRYDKRIREQGNAIKKKDTTASGLTKEMIDDIKNGISIKEYCEKYHVSESLCCIHKRIVKLNNKNNVDNKNNEQPI